MNINKILLIFVVLIGLIVTANATTYTCCKNFEISNGALQESFDNVSQWQKIGAGTTTSSNDTVNFREGTTALKLASINGDATNFDKNVSFSISDYTKFDFWLYVKPEDVRNISNFFIILSPTSNYASYYALQIGSSTASQQNDFISGWNHYSFNLSSMSRTGTPGLSIVKFRVKISPKAGQDANVTIDNFRVNMTSRAKVIFTFDDGLANISTLAYPVMQGNGQTGVSAIITNSVGTSGKMNLSDLNTLYSSGWDIASHSKSHQNLTAVSLANATSEIQDSHTYLTSNGFTRSADVFVYPYGSFNEYNDSIVDLVKADYKIARSYQRGYYQPNFNGLNDGNNTYLLRTYSVGNDSTPQNAYSKINDTINRSGLLIIVFHDIINEPSSSVSTKYTLTNFTLISDYVASRDEDIDVITLSDMLNEIPSPATRQDTSNQNTNNFISASITLLVFVLIISPVISRTPPEYKSLLAFVIAAVGITFIIIYMSI